MVVWLITMGMMRLWERMRKGTQKVKRGHLVQLRSRVTWRSVPWWKFGVRQGANLYEPCFKKSCKQTQQQHKVCVCEKTLDEGSIQLCHPLQEWKNVGTGGQNYVWGVRCKSWFGLWVFATLRALKVVHHCIVEIEVVNKCFSKE